MSYGTCNYFNVIHVQMYAIITIFLDQCECILKKENESKN